MPVLILWESKFVYFKILTSFTSSMVQIEPDLCFVLGAETDLCPVLDVCTVFHLGQRSV